MKNKKLIVILVITILIIIVGLLIIIFKPKENADLSDTIDNTINLKSYKLTVNVPTFRETIYKIDNVEKIVSDNEDNYAIDEVEIIKDNKLFGGNNEIFNRPEEDQYFYYYLGCNVSTDFNSKIVSKTNNLLELLKTYKYNKKGSTYVFNIKQGDTKLISAIKDYLYFESDPEPVYKKISITINDKYIEKIVINYTLLEEYDLLIEFNDYNNIKVSLPERIKASLAENYFNFITYGNNKDTDINHEKEYTKDNIIFVLGSSNGFFNAYFKINNGIKKVFIKNTTDEYEINKDHTNDIYNMYDLESKNIIGKFTYNDEVLKVYDAGELDGTYLISQ